MTANKKSAKQVQTTFLSSQTCEFCLTDYNKLKQSATDLYIYILYMSILLHLCLQYIYTYMYCVLCLAGETMHWDDRCWKGVQHGQQAVCERDSGIGAAVCQR